MRGRLTVSLLFVCVAAATAQPHGTHSKQTLFVAAARSENVVPSTSRSDATATGAFVLSSDARRIDYRLTYDGLVSAAVVAIDLHHYGAGGAGEVVHTICGRRAKRCPQQRGATLIGTWRSLTPQDVHELAARRIYLDVHTREKPAGETRAQLLTAPWMIHSQAFVGEIGGPGGRRSGTATFFLTPFPQFTQLVIEATVTGVERSGRFRLDLERNAGPAARPLDRGGETRGGSISVTLRSDRPEPAALPADIIEALESGTLGLVLVEAGRAPVRGVIRRPR